MNGIRLIVSTDEVGRAPFLTMYQLRRTLTLVRKYPVTVEFVTDHDLGGNIYLVNMFFLASRENRQVELTTRYCTESGARSVASLFKIVNLEGDGYQNSRSLFSDEHRDLEIRKIVYVNEKNFRSLSWSRCQSDEQILYRSDSSLSESHSNIFCSCCRNRPGVQLDESSFNRGSIRQVYLSSRGRLYPSMASSRTRAWKDGVGLDTVHSIDDFFRLVDGGPFGF